MINIQSQERTSIKSSEDMYSKLDELSNYDLGYTEEEWLSTIQNILYYLVEHKDLKERLSQEGCTPKGGRITLTDADSVLKLNYETSISNTLYIEFDVYLGVVSHKGIIMKNNKVICK